MKDLVVSSQGMRDNPHCCIITTAGFDVTKPCYRLRSYCLEVLSGLKQDDGLFAAIYELDEGDDYTDESNWPKSNPALGSAVRLDFIREQVNKAKNNPSDEVSVKTKTLNIWCQSADTWLTENIINKSTDKVNLEDFKG
jgi:phage terminase large subunit-like protein